MIPIRDNYNEVFQQEIDSYTEGLENYPGEIFPELVFRVVRELEESFVTAINHNYIFDVLVLARQIARAAKFLVHEKDIAFCILSVLPPPSAFNEEGQYTLAQIIDQLEKAHGNAIERLEKKWRWEIKFEREQHANSTSRSRGSEPASSRLATS